MAFHMSFYNATTAGAVTLTDLTALADPVFTQRNGHLTFTDELYLMAAQANAVALTEAVLKSPTWNAQTLFNVDPPMLSLTQTSPPRVMDLFDVRPKLPVTEEFQVQASDTQAAGEFISAQLWICSPNHTRNIPKGIGPLAIFCARVSATVVLTAKALSPLVSITFEQGLRQGVYSVVGGKFYIAGGTAFRLLFPRSTLYDQRAMRPGDLCSQAYGDLPWWPQIYPWQPWGEWGRFQTYEPPQLEVYANTTAASATYQGMLFLVKLNDSADATALIGA